MKLLIWRPTVTKQPARRTKVEVKSGLTPTKRSGSKVSASTVARKKHRHSFKEKKSSRKRDIADGVSLHEQVRPLCI